MAGEATGAWVRAGFKEVSAAVSEAMLQLRFFFGGEIGSKKGGREAAWASAVR